MTARGDEVADSEFDDDAAAAAMSPDPEIVHRRAELLPEERTVGSDDPEEQAEVVLEDSLARTEVPNAAPATHLERRSSEDTV